MKFNDAQFEALAKYEDYFRTAVDANWCRYPGHAGLEEVHDILKAALGYGAPLNAACGQCTLAMMREAGALWFADKAERIEKANEKRAVELTEAEAKPKKNVKIKTAK